MSTVSTANVSIEELQLATRNHGMPLEALRYPITPVGLHYLLTHYDIPDIDPTSWRLRVDGCVRHPLELSLTDLRSMPSTREVVTMECAGNGRALLYPRPASQPWLVEAVGTGDWSGVTVGEILEAAGVEPNAVDVLFTGADQGLEGGVEAGEQQSYQRSLPLDVATSSGALLAYNLSGAPLPPQHGAPLRLVVPGWYGMTNVKWLTSITVLDAPFTGYQQAISYRMRQTEDEAGEPLTRMLPRSLLIPPGIPDFLSRVRVMPAGECELAGRAWSGSGPIVAVDVSADGGRTWSPGEVEDATLGENAWQRWRWPWHAEPGDHELCCRATDATGMQQPLEPPWNLGGYTNNAIHRVKVHVVSA